MKFQWDQQKAAANEKKHGVSFPEAATIFADPLELTLADPDHSEGEFRFISMGMSATGRLLVVSYVEREAGVIRIISARQATRQEQKFYEQTH